MQWFTAFKNALKHQSMIAVQLKVRTLLEMLNARPPATLQILGDTLHAFIDQVASELARSACATEVVLSAKSSEWSQRFETEDDDDIALVAMKEGLERFILGKAHEKVHVPRP